MMTKDEALKLALGKMEYMLANGEWYAPEEAIAAIKEALAEPQQEPVAYVRIKTTGGNAGISWYAEPTGVMPKDGEALYTAPPKREWVGLTDAEVHGLNGQWGVGTSVIRCVEAKIKEKNHV